MLVVCAGGIAGMIVGSILDNNAIAMTFGLTTAAAVLCLLVATAVGNGPASGDVARTARVEELVGRLVDGGADEEVVRALVAEAGRGGPGPAGTELRRSSGGDNDRIGKNPSPPGVS